MKTFTPPNVYGSMTAYDPATKDRNQQQTMGSREEKNRKILELTQKYIGQQIKVVNMRSGEVFSVEFEDVQDARYAIRGRVWATHLIFGELRLATAEDIKNSEAKMLAEKSRLAKMEGERLATAASHMFKEMSETARTINDANTAAAKAEADANAAQVTVEEPLEEPLEAVAAGEEPAAKRGRPRKEP